jgi:hypothetical protein
VILEDESRRARMLIGGKMRRQRGTPRGIDIQWKTPQLAADFTRGQRPGGDEPALTLRQ